MDSFNHIGVHFSCYTTPCPSPAGTSGKGAGAEGTGYTAADAEAAACGKQRGKKAAKHNGLSELVVVRPAVWHRLVVAVDYVSDETSAGARAYGY